MSTASSQLNSSYDNPADDNLEGVNAIATFLRKSVRRTFYLLETGQLGPAYKQGRIWNLRPSAYRRHIECLEAAAIAAMNESGTPASNGAHAEQRPPSPARPRKKGKPPRTRPHQHHHH
jgi:hypothetical protein